MIIDTINNADKYFCLGDKIAVGLKYLKETDFTAMPDGKVEIAGEDIFAIVQRYNPISLDDGKWEAHRKYIDIQYIVSGTEQIGFGRIDEMGIVQEYSEQDDVLFTDGTGGDFVNMNSGMFMILFPHDVHKPCIKCGDIPDKVVKVVVKVRGE